MSLSKLSIYPVLFLLIYNVHNTKTIAQVYTQYQHQPKFVNIDCNIRETGVFVINNSIELWDLCTTTTVLPNIHFDEEILIGVIETTGGCSAPITSIEILQNLELKTIQCKVNIESVGGCRRLHRVITWFTIRRPYNKHSIEVSVNKSFRK